MKKILSLALTLCLLIATLSSVLVGTATASTTDTTATTYFGDSYFEDTSIWTAQGMNSHNWLDASDIATATVQSATTHSSEKAMQLTGGNWAYHKAALPALEQYTTYTLSFEYYAASGSYPSGATDIVRRIGIFLKDDTTKLTDGTWNISGTQNGYLNFITEKNSYITYDGINGKVTDASRMTTDAAFGTWYHYELIFRTGAASNNFYFIIEKSISQSVYVDNLSLTKGIAVESMVDPAAWMSYEQMGKGDYSSDATKTPYTGTNLSAANRSAITNASGRIPVKATTQDHDGDGTSLKTHAWLTFYATDFYVKPATYYELSFWYYCDTTKAADDGRIISTLNLAPHGTNTLLAKADAATTGYTYDAERNKITLASLGMKNVKSAGWHKLTVPFYSGANDILTIDFTNVCNSNNTYPVYLDEFNLQEVLPANYSENWQVTTMPGADEDKYFNTCTDVTNTSTAVTDNTAVYNGALDAAPIGLKVDAYAQYAFTEIAVEPKQYYDLEFYYYTDATDLTALGNKRIFSYVAVAEPDALIDSGALGNLAYVGDEVPVQDAKSNAYTVKNGIYTANSLKLKNDLQTWQKMTLSFYSADNTSVVFAVRPTVVETSAVYAYVDGISLTSKASVQTSYNSEAAIRAKGSVDGSVDKNGLRTYNAITADWLGEAEANIVEYGSIVIRQGYMNTKFADKTAPDLDMLSLVGMGVGLGVSYRAENASTPTSDIAGHTGAKNTHWELGNTDGIFAANIFTSYLTGIDAANYGEEYLVRAYAIAKDGTVYYGDTTSVSIYKVAQAIDSKYTGAGSLGESEANDIAAFNAFVGADPTAYADWCGEGKTGQLYAALTATAE